MRGPCKGSQMQPKPLGDENILAGFQACPAIPDCVSAAAPAASLLCHTDRADKQADYRDCPEACGGMRKPTRKNMLVWMKRRRRHSTIDMLLVFIHGEASINMPGRAPAISADRFQIWGRIGRPLHQQTPYGR